MEQIDDRLAPWNEMVLLCGKCARKLDGEGYGPKGRDSLRHALRAALKQAGRRRVKLVETRCLGICPKRAVTVALSARPGRVLIVPEGSSAQAVVTLLGEAGQPPP